MRVPPASRWPRLALARSRPDVLAGGKKKPLKAPKKQSQDVDEEDLAFKKKQQEQKKAEAAMRDKLAKKK